ncbi:MAG: hypothetical protein N3A53_01855, partial [Verrucomicrobiae bacterium]|nr:hypothetical protein [Verrucomicrobiae bacterium]
CIRDRLLAEQVSAHLAWHGVDLRQVEWQTDNGSEFLEDAGGRGLPSTVRAFGSGHNSIPPKAHTRQSDRQTVHRLEEEEFFDREELGSVVEFWVRVTTYWCYVNRARRSRGRAGSRRDRFCDSGILNGIGRWQPCAPLTWVGCCVNPYGGTPLTRDKLSQIFFNFTPSVTTIRLAYE